MNNKNVVLCYQSANIFNLEKYQQPLRSKVHITYHLVANRATFLELDYESVRKILGDSELETIPQLEHSDAVNQWIQHKSEERGRFANQLKWKIVSMLLAEAKKPFSERIIMS